MLCTANREHAFDLVDFRLRYGGGLGLRIDTWKAKGGNRFERSSSMNCRQENLRI